MVQIQITRIPRLRQTVTIGQRRFDLIVTFRVSTYLRIFEDISFAN